MQALTLSYVPESDDIAELAAKSPTRRRSRNRALVNSGVSLALTVIFGMPWTSSAYEPDTSLITLVCAVMFVGYSYRVVALSSHWGLRRDARRVWNRSSAPRRLHEAVINEEALTVSTEGVTHTYAWSTFSELAECDRQFVLMDRSGKPSVALPKRGLPDPSLIPVCRLLLSNCLENAGHQRNTATIETPADRRQSPATD
ncbi:YcxB family protein [Streptomyces gibsoniae]|uniref:YcxB family protein n=1 Tax=Streptomyces gibsoniae TaxID=3075529 RepID=A0ABU2U2B7_9ACTN|nr:YcxB family protein [Streptomyces sp. DSM 41699]MDT0467374.1 YcxB family protein [Streptomyces sp. DSM 41699]